MAFVNKFLLLLFSFCFISVYSYEYIPVYMWETSKNYSPLPALGRLNGEFFKDILLDKFNKKKVMLVFLEENLSPEDLTTFDSAGESVFYSLSHFKSEAQVNYYPFVEAPLKALQSLPGVKVSKVDVTPNGLPSDVKIEPGQVLIVDLNDAKENEDRSHMLRRHDSLLASIYKSVLSENDNVIALYTARHSSWLVPSELDGNGIGRKARHLMEASSESSTESSTEASTAKSTTKSTETSTAKSTEKSTAKSTAKSTEKSTKISPEKSQDTFPEKYILVKEKGTMMYTNAPIVFNVSGNSFVIEKVTSGESTDNITVLSSDKAKISFQFEDNLGYWILQKIVVEHEKTEYNFTVRELFAPFGFSYHCNNALYGGEISTEEKYYLSLPGFQVQRFSTKEFESFSDAYDCIGFTTAPIWSGIFVSFLLASIMAFGLCMIMDIRTMDRFDDPKGKTISVNVVD